jgi:hypothetical protein
MADPRLNVSIASSDRRMFEITLPNIGKIVCEATTKLPGPAGGRDEERKALAKANAKQLGDAFAKALESY